MRVQALVVDPSDFTLFFFFCGSMMNNRSYSVIHRLIKIWLLPPKPLLKPSQPASSQLVDSLWGTTKVVAYDHEILAADAR